MNIWGISEDSFSSVATMWIKAISVNMDKSYVGIVENSMATKSLTVKVKLNTEHLC